MLDVNLRAVRSIVFRIRIRYTIFLFDRLVLDDCIRKAQLISQKPNRLVSDWIT